ncbi:MAG: hypothetical protein ACYTDW_20370 [Planctomycetota bacterium]
MDIFHIEGPVRLSGSVKINGSKNASLPSRTFLIFPCAGNCLASWAARLVEAQTGIYA